MNKGLLVFVAAWFSTALGCATAEVMPGPDGTPHQLLTCGHIKGCYTEAREVCGGKYKIVHSSNEVYGDAKSTSSYTRLLVKCQASSEDKADETLGL